MTNPNNQTNGASLEDCHTNFFALTDLCGIKWRKLIWGDWGDCSGSNDVLEDPVLGSYVRCIAADILCVWRRVSSPPQIPRQQDGLFDPLGMATPAPAPNHPPLSLNTAKELWIFWYGEEPDLSNIVSPELLSADGEQGSWESGLSYECRSLLFKALHNLIERCLLSRDFVRLGKWYVQPYDSSEKLMERSGHLSFSFDFFVHGESTVCASVDVRQHPAVRTLLSAHLQQAQSTAHSSPPVQVILAPFGLAGTLTGQGFRVIDPYTQKLLDGWKSFYPVEKGFYPENSDLPPAVEVVVGGLKMRYPSNYVLITDLDESTNLFNNHTSNPPNTPTLPLRGVPRGGLLAERVWQETCVISTSGHPCNGTTNNNPPTPGGTNPPSPSLGQWSFVDPSRKTPCSCSCKLNCTSSGQADSIPIASVGSPTSGAPSPTPASVPPPDPTMPTLSPQPPPPHQSPLDDKVVSTPTDFNAPKSVSSISNQVLSPYGDGGVKSEPVKTPAVRTPTGPPCSAPTPPPQPPIQILKRPVLTTVEYEDALHSEHRPSPLLYDYSTLNAWLNHPVKRHKTTMISQQPPVPPLQNIKQEPMDVDGGMVFVPRGPGDPYEFDEEGMGGVRMDTFKRGPNEDDKSLVNGTTTTAAPGKITTGNLFTSEGLQVSYNDIDQIFDQSDDNSGDEALQVTPPSSNKPDECLTVIPRQSCATTGILRPEELSKMFPTPPSLEHNPIASPCPGVLSDTPPDPPPLPPAPPASLGSPNHEPIQDWSYVFKPPVISKFVGSTKYAPLLTLPSHNLPPVNLPSSCSYKPSWAVPHHQEKQNSSPSGRANNNSTPTNTSSAVCSSGGPPSVGMASNPSVSGAPSPGVWGSQNRLPPNQAPPLQAPPPYSPATPLPYPAPASQHKVLEHHSPNLPEANSLVITVLLSDTSFNIFRDHNFDSCTLCVCNAGPKVVGNIRGGDAGMYLPIQGGSGSPYPLSPAPHLSIDDEPIRCNCGFSAVVNRRLAHRAGLFIEDEFEITGVLEEPNERENNGVGGLGRNEMALMQEQCLVMNSSSNSLYRAASHYRPLTPVPAVNLLALKDSNQLCAIALEQGRLAHANNPPPMCKMEEMGCMRGGNILANGSVVHRWSYLRAGGPSCNQDIVRVMKQLQPLLQDAIQKKCSTRLWEAPTVSGPLTWRQFHRLAGRGTDDRCEPQPIPSLLVGRERDWASLSPYAIHLWEKLLLEPFSYSRDVAYIVVAPDNDFILSKVRTFFKELSSTYEICRLGRHCPITRILKDGILSVNKAAEIKLIKDPIDDWFSLLGDNNVASMLKLYAQVCRHHLTSHLSQVPMDKSLLDPPEGTNLNPARTSTPLERPTPSPRSEQPNTPKQESQDDCSGGNSSGTESTCGSGYPGGSAYSNSLPHSNSSSTEDEDSGPPAVVVYLVDPFTTASDNPEVQRLACVALLRAFNTVLSSVPESIRSNVYLQVISLESIIELGRSGDTNRRGDHMRSLALSVFSQCRRVLQHTTNNVKALTGFGTAASNELFLKNKDEKNKAPYKVYSPAYVLAKSRDKPSVTSGTDSEVGVPTSDHCSVLYVSYCLSEDQRWLLATATDEQGLILETVTINVHIPNRNRRRKASARRAGLQKLMDFMMGVMSQSVTPWRLVVGRVGRIGHGELKGWSWLLSRKSLLKASKHLKEICGQCNLLYPNDVPCILSACLVSLEPDSALRLMPDQFTPDERFSQASVKCQLSTPHDVTATHILVFPTSATTQSSQTAFHEQHISGQDLDEDLFSVLDDDMPEGMGDFNDIFSTWSEAEPSGQRSPTGSPRPRQDSTPGSPAGGLTPHQHSPYNQHANNSRNGENSEEVGTLLQQPLALGFLVSTAPTGRMPRWFWSACPHLEATCPAFLKNALHLHSTAIQQNTDELLQQQAVAGHPLDSQYTTDVLRYVLEGYNALSWLALDPNSHDRLSCLPVHMQVLMQLYHMTSALA